MVASVAVLSDIHGALPALEAVLAEPEVGAAERIVLTGDIAAGPMPVETLDLLTSLGERVVWVRGNADRELVAMAHGAARSPERGTSGGAERDRANGGASPIPDPVAPWAAAQLRPDHVELLASLPHPVVLDVDGFGPVAFCHGTPRDDDEVVLVDSSLERWAEVFGGLGDEVRTVVCGHTHMPFQRLVDRRLVVNPGSVGMPYGRSGPHWAILRDGTATLHHSRVAVETVAARLVSASTYPQVEQWAEEYVRAVHSDAEALTVFARRDGRSVPPG